MAATEWLTVDELAAELKVPKATIYKWRANREGPRAAQIGRHLRFRRGDVDAWLEAVCLETPR
ncbi:helix-turn-helix domain-containing protein [Cryptosporangium arvum]|uniref:DNA-binding protein, excisionase family n=1 Tax=Cryptosporangium arvum DSM 44712 TaxID=927661 RepID=A0A010YJ93_9ACTN|nr:helix-turn-helix domain-containing protein [Cryptosporangium arvum]EXG80270.1 DNA-binding protein, excisionase family [Cryptosporangium arvum DSM 44712]